MYTAFLGLKTRFDGFVWLWGCFHALLHHHQGIVVHPFHLITQQAFRLAGKIHHEDTRSRRRNGYFQSLKGAEPT